MASTKDICNFLQLIITNLKPDSTHTGCHEVMANVMRAIDRYRNERQNSELIGRMDDTVSTLQSSDRYLNANDLIAVIDDIIRALNVLNASDESAIISSVDSLAIESAVIKLISLTYIPYVCDDFPKMDELFQSNSLKAVIDCDLKHQLLSTEMLLRISDVLIQYANSKSLISKSIIDHSFAPIISFYICAKRKLEASCDKLLFDSIASKLDHLLANSEQTVVIRNLLLLLRCKPVVFANKEISRCLSRCLTRENGLTSLMSAVVDSDETSQVVTTHNQRFIAVSTIVTAMPQLFCPLRQYYCLLSPQIFELLTHTNQCYWKIGAMIVNGLEQRNKKLSQEIIVNKLVNAIKTGDDLIPVYKAVEIIYRLITNRYNNKNFVPIVSHLFYIRVILNETLSHCKSLLDHILIDIFNSSDNSVYLLDKTLCYDKFLLNLYETNSIDGIIGIKISDKFERTNELSHDCDDSVDLRQTDQIADIVIQIIRKLYNNFKVDFFLLLLERMTFNPPLLLTCALVDSLQEEVSVIIIEYAEKSINFIANTLQRVAAQKSNSDSTSNNIEDLNSDRHYSEMQNNSLVLCLQIIKILLTEKEKLSQTNICQIKQCLPSLEMLAKCDTMSEPLKTTAAELKIQIEMCRDSGHTSFKSESNSKYELAMNDLNSHLMPSRAHALIVLKQLIYARDEHVLKSVPQLVNAFKMCLNDDETYIYLSAINSLAALAVIATDEVLPILTAEFSDSQRSIGERLNVGQVLVQLSRYIADFSHHYSRQYINCFLIGTKSEEPSIRVSSLSNLGQFCGVLRFALKPYIVELMLCVICLLKSDANIEVKRASVMFLHLMFRGIDVDVIECVDEHLREIYGLLRRTYATTLDDILQLHSQLAIEEIDRIAKDLLTPKRDLIKNIKI